MASADASHRQATSATAAAKQLMDQDTKKTKESAAEDAEKLKQIIAELRQKIKVTEEDRSSIQEQASELKKEYDTLMDQHSSLEKVLKRTGGIKKDD